MHAPMKFAIIAAGDGSRLKSEGAPLPKPLVPIGGEPMVGRLVKLMRRCGADKVSIIVNPADRLTVGYLETLPEVRLVLKATPSSMHSLYELRPFLEGGMCCVTTVDTIFREDEFADYLQRLETCSADCLMGVTAFVDDEKPLYVGVDGNMCITGFYDSECGCRYVSGGIYGLNDRALQTLQRCVEGGQSRMRSFQRQLVTDGLKLEAFAFGKIVDVDHLSDVEEAERLIENRQL